jgi:phosphopantothenoylcysteine decarboxylase/phosphopantothenate--cysteine ligase
MYENPAVQSNIERLKGFGVEVVGPGEGDLACGEEGPGRLSDIPEIVAYIERALAPGLLKGLKVLVSAGPTREFLDRVRYISNPSTGKMGFALARAAWTEGADVTLVAGPSRLAAPFGVSTVRITTAEEMKREVENRYPEVSAVIMASAVSDFKPKSASAGKVKKEDASLSLELERNPDILASLGKKKDDRVLVGFAAESEDLRENARKKLKVKNLDFIVANDITRPDSGFGSDTNIVTIIYPDGRAEELPLMSKHEVAHNVVLRVAEIFEGRRKPGR